MTKLALIIGINYIGTDSQLEGCINDAMNLKHLLIDHFNYLAENITLLTDETEKKPTSANILSELYKLLVQSHDDDIEQIWISYSGHGTWTPDMNGDEADGRDEMIVPLDMKCIKDDVLNHIISLIQQNSQCMCLFDSCHSGTMLDLPYKFQNTDYTFIHENRTEDLSDDIHQVLMFSGCKDDQYSEEAWMGKIQGAMTTVFIYLLQKYNYKVSYKQLICEMNDKLELYGFEQRPRLSCNKCIDINSLFQC